MNLRHGHRERKWEEDDLLLLFLGFECQQQRQELLQFLQHDLLLDLAVSRNHMFGYQDEVQEDDGKEDESSLLALVESHDPHASRQSFFSVCYHLPLWCRQGAG